jgi:gluconokinase
LKDFVLHELTGCWVADVSLASATGLLDVHDRQWHVPSLGLAGVSADELPDLNQPGEVVGSIDSGAASLCHLPEGLPVITAASDGALANLGAGAVEDELVITVGTSAAVRMINSAPHFDEQLRTWCYVFDESRWLNGGAMNSGGMALQHVAERFYGAMPIERALQRMETEASQIAPGADGLIVLPFINGERGLIWSSRAEFELIGWNETRHGPAHVVRAAMEAVALCLAELAEAMPRPAHEAARLTGGVTRSMLWRQIIADVLGRSLRPVDAADASALGAAVMGLVSIGADKGSLQWLGCANEQVEPDSAARERYQSLRHRFVRACDRAGYLVC